MRNNLFIMPAAVLVLLSSCMKESISAPESLNDDNVTVFDALLETSASKTVLNDDLSVSWAVGDDVKFDYEAAFDIEGESTSLTGALVSDALIEEDLDGETGGASFRVEGIPDVYAASKKQFEAAGGKTRRMYATYPSSVVTDYSQAPTFYVTVPAVQDGKFENASIALAKYNTDSPNAPLNFYNLCGLLSITVNDAAVRQVKLTSSEYLAGKANIGFKSTLPWTPYVKALAAEEGVKCVTLNIDGPGKYYFGVLPAVMKDLSLSFYDAEGTFLGEKLSSDTVELGRAEILNLGTFGDADYQTPGKGGFFVKPVATGTGDGSSWDNAADYAGLHAKLDNTTNYITDTENPENNVNNAVTLTVYMAGGTYPVASQLNVTPSHDVEIYGGYPSDANGVSLSGRDVKGNPTVLDGGNTVKIWNITNGIWVVDGLTFQDAKASAGAVITLQKTVSMTVTDCMFRNNEATGAGGGAVLCQGLTSESVLFEDCEFVGNSASTTTSTSTGLGGAVMGSSIPTAPGTITFSNCLFKENTAALGGGAICPRTMNCRLLDCTFVDNSGESYGDAIYLENSATVTTYCDGCNFYYTDSEYVKKVSAEKNATITVNNANSILGISNSVVNGPWAGSTSQILVLKSKSVVIVNSTLFAQTSYPLVLVKGGEAHAINSIFLNAASEGKGRGLANQSAACVYNSVFTKVDEKVDGANVEVTAKTEKTDYSNNLKVVSKTAETFPVDPTWYGAEDYAGLMWGNKNATTTEVTDCRGKLYYYAWDGVYPEGATFTNATLDQVKGWVNDADENFATWLGDRLGKDIRGKARDAQSMWPGSYQN